MAGGLRYLSEGRESLLSLGGTMTGCDRVVSMSTMGQLNVKIKVGHTVVEMVTTGNTTGDWTRESVIILVDLSLLSTGIILSFGFFS